MCLQKQAKLLWTPCASLAKWNRYVASGNIPHLDALILRAAHKAAVYILELTTRVTTMEIFVPYAMMHRQP